MILAIGLSAFAASLLTFFSGFGLGTLLLPVFAVFFPVSVAVALTALVHFLNNLLKLTLMGKHADRRVVIRFGLPALASSFAGAWLLGRLSGLGPWFAYSAFGRTLEVWPVKSVIALLMVAFGCFELVPKLREKTWDEKYLAWGGIASGFFGGLSGHQGALRSAFLTQAGLSRESFIGTGVVIACLVDASRLSVYFRRLQAETLDWRVMGLAALCAFLGTFLGSRRLHKTTMPAIRKIVGWMLLAIAFGLGGGWI